MHSRPGVVAWVAAALGLILVVAGTGIGSTDRTFQVAMVRYGAVGAVIVSRRANRIGWLMVGIGSLTSLSSILATYLQLSQQHGGTFPLAELGGVVAMMTWAPIIALVGVTLLHNFPDGQLASPKFRWGARTAPAFVICAVIGTAFRPGPMEVTSTLTIDNPIGVPGWSTASVIAGDLSGILLLVGAASGVLSIAIRFRNGTPTVRAQLKWFGLGAATMPVAFFIGDLNEQRLEPVVVPFALVAVAVAIGIAILRHRLYDIDRLISRTLAWGVTTGILVGIYVALSVVPFVLVLGAGDGAAPDVVVAGATLASAAAFRPVRDRVQTAVDRRFNRSRYDAGRVVEAFGMRLRDNLDVDGLCTQVRQVVAESFEPAHVAVWLRPRRHER